MSNEQLAARGPRMFLEFGLSKKVIGVLAVSLLALTGIVGVSEGAKANGDPTTPCTSAEAVPAPDTAGVIRISTPGQLKQLSASQDSYRSRSTQILITANINLASDCLWTPLGAGGNFEGVFDGGGFSISNVFVSRTSGEGDPGFFGAVKGGVVKNLTLTGTVSGATKVGGLASEVWSSSTISNVRSEVNVTATQTLVGGLVGALSDSRVESSSSTGTVSSTGDRVGGLIGKVSGLTTVISQSFSSSNVTGSLGIASPYLGGFVGELSGGSVINCFSTGQIVSTGSNTQRLSGFVGQTSLSSITNSYHSGPVSSAAPAFSLDNAGLFVGNHSNDATISGSVARSDAAHSLGTNRKFRGLGSGTLTNTLTETSQRMKAQSTFTALGWDFENVWAMSESTNSTFQGFPVLKWQGLPVGGGSNEAPSGSSAGFSSAPQTTIASTGNSLIVNLNKTRELRLTGSNLNLVTEAGVGGKKATINFVASDSGNLVISTLPLLPSGKYTLTLLTPTGLVAGEVEVGIIARITKLRAIEASGKLSKQVRSEVRKQNLTYDSAGTLSCWGVTTSSSGSALALAKQKAEKVCAYAKRQNPELDIVASSRTGTGKPARNQVVKLRYLK
jgi:hypothetical protein